jgi:hypothetical protein
LARGTWHGSPSAAPEALQAWVALPEVFHWAQARKDGDRSYTIQLQGLKTSGHRGERDLSSFEYTRGGEEILVRLQQ